MGLIRLLFPPKCAFCGDLLHRENRMEICDNCLAKIHFIDCWLPLKDRGKPVWSLSGDVFCMCEYSGIVRDALMRFKFYDRPSCYRAFALMLAERVKKMTNEAGFDIIISVPMHSHKQRLRGYNQSRLVSAKLSAAVGIPDGSSLLSRIRDTAGQSRLNREQRLVNLQGAFQVNDRKKISGKDILLIDDIVTTGTTLYECGRSLTEAGAKSVHAAVIATGRIPGQWIGKNM